jgi:hypothetical protein
MSPMDNRDWYRGQHPPTCTCVECTNRRLGVPHSEPTQSMVSQCPVCGRKSLFYNRRDAKYECLNLDCKATGHTIEMIRRTGADKKPKTASESVSHASNGAANPPPRRTRASSEPFPNWLSVIFSVEQWFVHITTRYRTVGKAYRLILNLTILSVLGFSIWSGVKVFSKQFASGPLAGTIVFLAEIAFCIWLWRVVAKNSWRWPSMKLTMFSLSVVFVVSALAGVQPSATYKDRILETVRSWQTPSSGAPLEVSKPTLSPLAPTTVSAPTLRLPTAPTAAAKPPADAIDARTGKYKDYFLGLAQTSKGPLGGSGCYGSQFIVLINNANAVNPSYSQLVNFLQQDKTDRFPYTYNNPVSGMYFGTAESHVDLQTLKRIIDGTEQPKNPCICGDFAERLHNNAEMAGIRCGYVSIDLSGYPDTFKLGIPSNTGHALNVFQTTDRGTVYIDVTNAPGPSRCVTTIDLKEGGQYIPQSVFPDPGWGSTWGSMGTVAGIEVLWDGSWKN